MSKLFDLIFGKQECLLRKGSFSSGYELRVKNTFKMGIENPVVSLETVSNLSMDQRVKEENIFNTIRLNSITGSTESEIMRPHLEQSLVLADITKTIKAKRNANGKVSSIENTEVMWEEWQRWQKENLEELIPNERSRKQFINNYEKGLKDFEVAFKNNLQYQLMLPEIYEIVSPPIQHYNYMTSTHTFTSRMLGAELKYNYVLELSRLKDNEGLMDIGLRSLLGVNTDYTNTLEPYYKQMGVDISNFKFEIKMDYLIEKSTSKILSAQLTLLEKIHDNMSYSIEMELTSK